MSLHGWFLSSFLALTCGLPPLLDCACVRQGVVAEHLPPPRAGADDRLDVPAALRQNELREGYYIASGQSYELVASIRKARDIYLVQWYGDDSPYGPGKRMHNTLVVGFSGRSGRERGVAVMAILPDGRLRCQWSQLPGDGRWHDEEWEFLRPFRGAAADGDGESEVE
jgi:hypothetical protein